MLPETLKLKYMAKKSSKKCSRCGAEKDFNAKHSKEADKLLLVSINTPPLTLKELKKRGRRKILNNLV